MPKLRIKYNEAQKEVLAEIEEWEKKYNYFSTCIFYETLITETNHDNTYYIFEVARTEGSKHHTYCVIANETGEFIDIGERPKSTIADFEKQLGYFLERTDEDIRPRILTAIRTSIHDRYKLIKKLK